MKKTLSEYRLDRNMTQRQLAEEVGIPISSIAMYETGDRTPTLKKAQVLADFFGVRIDDIFFGKAAHETGATSQAHAG